MSLQERQGDDEEVLERLAPRLAHQLAGRRSRAARCNQIAGRCQPSPSIDRTSGARIAAWSTMPDPDSLDNDHFLPRRDRPLLQLKHVLPVLLDVGRLLALARQLAALADGHECGAESKGDDRAEQEAAGVQANNNVGLDAGVLGGEMVDKVGDEGLEGVGVA